MTSVTNDALQAKCTYKQDAPVAVENKSCTSRRSATTCELKRHARTKVAHTCRPPHAFAAAPSGQYGAQSTSASGVGHDGSEKVEGGGLESHNKLDPPPRRGRIGETHVAAAALFSPFSGSRVAVRGNFRGRAIGLYGYAAGKVRPARGLDGVRNSNWGDVPLRGI